MSLTEEQRQRAFGDAITFDAFVAHAVNFTNEFSANYAVTALDQDDRITLAGIPEPIDVLAIVEDWCPDVVANLPIVARIADDTGALRLHVLIRDEAHSDIAAAYPYEGRSHIPTYVFFDADGAELGIIVERPAPIRTLVAVFLDGFLAKHPELDRSTFPSGLSDELRAELRDGAVQLRRQYRELERTSLVAEIQALALSDRSKSAAV